jgi:hypothetical protein
VTSTQKVKRADVVAMAKEPASLADCHDFRDRKKRTAPA